MATLFADQQQRGRDPFRHAVVVQHADLRAPSDAAVAVGAADGQEAPPRRAVGGGPDRGGRVRLDGGGIAIHAAVADGGQGHLL